MRPFALAAVLAFALSATCHASCEGALAKAAIPVILKELGSNPTSFELSVAGDRMIAGLSDGRVVELDGRGTITRETQVSSSGWALATFTGKNVPVLVAGKERRVQIGHAGTPGSYSFRTRGTVYAVRSWGEKLLAVATDAGIVYLYDTAERRCLRKLKPPVSWLARLLSKQVADRLAFSPDGTKLAVSFGVDNDLLVSVFDLTSFAVLHTNISGDKAPKAMGMRFTPNGQRLALAFRTLEEQGQWVSRTYLFPLDGSPRILAAELREPCAELKARDALDVDFAADGSTLAIARGGSLGVSYSPVGKPWITHGRLPTIDLLRLDGDVVKSEVRLVGHDLAVDFVRILPDGEIVSAGRDGLVAVWDTASLSDGQTLALFQHVVHFDEKELDERYPAHAPFLTVSGDEGVQSGIGYPPGYLMAFPPDRLYPRGRRALPGGIVDESLPIDQ